VETRSIQYGIYNLGFCALRDTSQTRRVVAWWGRRLENDCVIDFARGIFVDQKWADYFPAFIEKNGRPLASRLQSSLLEFIAAKA
jgi:hypothetical protein